MAKKDVTREGRTPVKPAMPEEMQTISAYLADMQFKKRLWGVDEADVWRKIEKLCEYYEHALNYERARAERAQAQMTCLYAMNQAEDNLLRDLQKQNNAEGTDG